MALGVSFSVKSNLGVSPHFRTFVLSRIFARHWGRPPSITISSAWPYSRYLRGNTASFNLLQNGSFAFGLFTDAPQ
jgi:hypothetical protein